MVIASMDIEKFYNNILAEESAKEIRDMWEESELTIDGIDTDTVSKYLGIHLKKEEVVKEGFEELIYTKEIKPRKVKVTSTKKVGKKPVKNKIINKMKKKNQGTKKDTNNGDEGDDTLNTIVKKKVDNETKKKKSTTVWIKPKRIPTQNDERKLFGKALEIMLITCMNCHVYQFGNKFRIQKKGGPIGLKLTGEIADCIMINWDKKLHEKLKKFKIKPELYTRFKDDIDMVIESLEKGSNLIEDKIVVDENKKFKDENVSDAKMTMEIVQKIANGINPMIQLTVDTPCNYPDGKLPVLDLTVNMNPVEGNQIE